MGLIGSIAELVNKDDLEKAVTRLEGSHTLLKGVIARFVRRITLRVALGVER